MVLTFCSFPNWIFCYPFWRILKWREIFKSVLLVGNKLGDSTGKVLFCYKKSVVSFYQMEAQKKLPLPCQGGRCTQECEQDSACASWCFLSVCSDDTCMWAHHVKTGVTTFVLVVGCHFLNSAFWGSTNKILCWNWIRKLCFEVLA